MAQLRGLEARRREREFVRLLASGLSARQAAADAGVSPARALRLLSDPALWQVFVQSRIAA